MINPNQVTNFQRTRAELEEFLLFAIIVAGKNSQQMSKKLARLFSNSPALKHLSPFEFIRYIDSVLEQELKLVSMGQYSRISAAFRAVVNANLNLKTCTIEELEALPGIGPKTARFFVLHSRENAQVAVLDTHILKFLRALGIEAPKQTPRGKHYKALEQAFIRVAASFNTSVAQLDLAIWRAYSSS